MNTETGGGGNRQADRQTDTETQQDRDQQADRQTNRHGGRGHTDTDPQICTYTQ